MRKEDKIAQKVKEFLARPKVAHAAPRIVQEYTRDGIRYYKDDAGAVHDAAVFDRVFGKRQPMDLKAKAKFSRFQPLQ